MLLEWNARCLADYANQLTCENSHAGLAPKASNIPIKIRIFNLHLIWILHHSSDEQIIKMVTDIKFAIMNSLIRSSEERLSCFDCNMPPVCLLSNRS